MKKCGFIGHRDYVGIKGEIYDEINTLIKRGIIEFYSGGMGNFDKTCEKAVKELGGKLVFIPYNSRCIKERDKQWYDEIICPFGTKPYTRFDIPNRNKWIIQNCDILLCFVYKDGGAKNTFDYAIKQHKQIVNLASD